MTIPNTATFTPRGPTIGSAQEQERAADLRVIVSRVARERSLSPDVIRGKSRIAHHVSARRQVCVEAREAGFSLSEIGRAIHRDHSTVLGLLRKADAVAMIEKMSRVEVAEGEVGAKITIDLSPEEAKELFRIAAPRKEAATNMLSDVVRFTIIDNLFSAILDR